MIKNILLKNFKIFKEETIFPFSNFTLLTGVNGGGKSTVLQSILLFKQTAENSNNGKFSLKGQVIDLGTFSDIKNKDTVREEPINIKFDFNDKSVDAILRESTSHLEVDLDLPEYKNSDSLGNVTQIFNIHLFDEIHYVSADRFGPQNYVVKQSLPIFINVGSQGENLLNVLEFLKDVPVNDILYRGKNANTLLQQTQEWLSMIFGETKFDVQGLDESSPVLLPLLNRFKPKNVGYGFYYILPIIVTGLIAKSEEIIIIENPEAHLHPKAQSELIKFLALVAQTGVQIIIESHSEHILNAFRVAINKQ